ncbi:DUF397 domain-containing protein [Saccharothrix longispora]|uniref:DUF397 domain-containing protein n=1 Tax=Saccharothrix longispora TaxID=33920 RepID=UPI0028FD6851|nr:DUF397 domain-containing protein [Saccharothrix longispora]MDU0292739.1 DUF397 domain-containing protein [Saccharothrix longispora]
MEVRWRKSSRSGSANDCVEVASHLGALRDSKNPAAVLEVSPRRLRAFVQVVKKS